MDDLERRTHQFLRDWQVLRQSLECVPQDQRGDPFFHTQLDMIAASIGALHEIVHSITRCPALSADGEPHAGLGERTSAPHHQPLLRSPHPEGLGAYLRRIRDAEETWDESPWRGADASGG
jgi:hypothetical protein